jgi:hypothetical protein
MSNGSISSNCIVVTTGIHSSVSIPNQVTGQLSPGEQLEILLPNGGIVVIRKTKCPTPVPEPAQIILPNIILAPPFNVKVPLSFDDGEYDDNDNDDEEDEDGIITVVGEVNNVDNVDNETIIAN